MISIVEPLSLLGMEVKRLAKSNQIVGDTTHAMMFVNKLITPMTIPFGRNKLIIVQIIPSGMNTKPIVKIPKIPNIIPSIPKIKPHPLFTSYNSNT